MDPILFYGVPEGCSFGSIVALEWSGMPYRLCRVRTPEVASGALYRRINPVGETPTLMSADGRFVSESIAILHHIAARASDKDLGFLQGTPEFDRLNRMLAFLNTRYFSSFAPLWNALERGSQGAEKEVLESLGRAWVRRAHAALEGLLGDQEWLLGGRRSLADAYFIGVARWGDFHRVVDWRDYPRLRRLREALERDPAVRFAYAIEHEEPATGDGFRGHVRLEEVLEGLRAGA